MDDEGINTQALDTDAAATLAKEERVWRGTPSQMTNILPFLSCLLIIPIPWAIYRWLLTRCHVYEVTTQRIHETRGIFSKKTDMMEIYRIKDMRLDQPFLLRLVGAGNIVMMTSDRTSENFMLRAIRPKEGPRALMDVIRKCVELRRDQKRVREVDMEGSDQT